MKSADVQPRHSQSAIKTLDIELDGLLALRSALEGNGLGQRVDQAIAAMAATQGRVIVTGMGKSGLIARKIAATLRSTGTSALFLHPGEASHGDLGVITSDDLVLALTWSGETAELNDIYRYCAHFDVPLIVVTSRSDSTAGRAADICLELPPVREACPNQLAPTSSTTLQLVLGDALAVALIEARGFTPSDFRMFHPGGRLGAQLTTVGDIMGFGQSVPRVTASSSLSAATLEMSLKRYGCTAVVDELDHLIGAFTDGDLRRCITRYSLSDPVSAHMTTDPITVAPSMLATEALRVLNDNAVSALFVEQDGKLVGIVHIHDIVRTGTA